MSLILQEVGIVVAMQQPHPNLVTAEFLKLSGIIPPDWQLARQPLNTDKISQLLFTNGVSITAEPNRIMFGETIGDKDITTLTVATIAQNYLNIFKVASYQAIGINIRSYSPQPNSLAATQYINHQLLSDGSWQNYGNAPIQAALNIIYTLEGRQLNLEIAAAGIQFSVGEATLKELQEITPVILFSGNFSYNLAASGVGDNLAAASPILANWQTDLSAYCELITDRFLSPSPPAQTAPSVSIGRDDLEGIEIVDAPNLYPLIALS